MRKGGRDQEREEGIKGGRQANRRMLGPASDQVDTINSSKTRCLALGLLSVIVIRQDAWL